MGGTSIYHLFFLAAAALHLRSLRVENMLNLKRQSSSTGQDIILSSFGWPCSCYERVKIELHLTYDLGHGPLASIGALSFNQAKCLNPLQPPPPLPHRRHPRRQSRAPKTFASSSWPSLLRFPCALHPKRCPSRRPLERGGSGVSERMKRGEINQRGGRGVGIW
jgi:hypothetical protein